MSFKHTKEAGWSPIPDPVPRLPQPGQWWGCDNHGTASLTIVYITGKDHTGRLLYELISGEILTDCTGWNGWKHLPNCTGFDWVEPVYPQYYIPKDTDYQSGYGKVIAYVIRRTHNHGSTYHVDGTTFNWEQSTVPNYLIQSTKEQALARVKPEPTVNIVPIPLYINYKDYKRGYDAPVKTLQGQTVHEDYKRLKWDYNRGFYVETTN